MSESKDSQIDKRAQSGFADGASYDRGRPGFSDTIVQRLLEELRVSGQHGARILDLAAGTGKFTEALARRDEAFDVVAVEPHAGMRRVLETKALPRVHVADGLATRIPLPDESVDAVVAAQAFHWFANAEALREIHRVMKPHAVLGLVWNIDALNSPRGDNPYGDKQGGPPTEWEMKAKEIMWRFGDDQPAFRHDKWRAVFDEQRETSPLALLRAKDQLFSLPLGEHIEFYDYHMPKEKAWERFNTYSFIAVLEGEERERTYQSFMDAIDQDKEAHDADGNVISHGYTIAVWTSKIPEDGRPDLIDVERTGS